MYGGYPGPTPTSLSASVDEFAEKSPELLALAMAVLFTLGMASSVMRGVCRKEEAAAAEETKALLGDSKYGATK